MTFYIKYFFLSKKNLDKFVDVLQIFRPKSQFFFCFVLSIIVLLFVQNWFWVRLGYVKAGARRAPMQGPEGSLCRAGQNWAKKNHLKKVLNWAKNVRIWKPALVSHPKIYQD